MSPYDEMILNAGKVDMRWNIAAEAALWILLAGFLVIPGTFTSLERNEVLGTTALGRATQEAIQNLSLLVVACIFWLIGIGLTGYLWSRFRHNYLWLINRIFL
jgi:hypothetical protein